MPFSKGRLTRVSSSISESRYTQFDISGRLLQFQQITDGETYTSSYLYNLSGALVEETYPSGRKVRNEFQSDGNLSKVESMKAGSTVFATHVSNLTYNAIGAVASLRLGNGRWEQAKFNSRLQPTELGLGISETDTSIWKNNYEYGELQTNGTVDGLKNTGNIARQTLTIPGMSFIQSYKYDSLYRLTEAKETTGAAQNWIQNWSYDRYGNRTGFTQNIGGSTSAPNPATDASTNRFSAGQGFGYDKNGNIVNDIDEASSLPRQFVFNGDNKQTEVKRDGVTIGRYYYDGEGRRVKKITDSETTVFVYSAGKLIAEYSTQFSQNPGTSYTTTDHLGSPRVITDATGQVKARRDFLPFGEDIYTGVGGRTTQQGYGSSADNIRQKFTGYQRDDETNLDFAEARYYNNNHGRFTAVDPLLASGKSTNPQTFNRYIYVGNNPLFWVDPFGLMWGINGDNQVRWFDNKLGDGFTDFTPENGQYIGQDNRVIQLDASSSKWSYVVPVEVVADSNPIQELAAGVSQGVDDAITGLGTGVVNFGIGTLNTLTQPLGPAGATLGVPNPLAIDSIPYDNASQAAYGSAAEF